METFKKQYDALIAAGVETMLIAEMPNHVELTGCELKVLNHFKDEYSVLNITDEDSEPISIKENTPCRIF